MAQPLLVLGYMSLCFLLLCPSLSGAGSLACNVSLPCSDIFCGQGGFLEAANAANIFADPKSIVDLPLRNASNATIAAFQQLQSQNGGNASAGQLQAFVSQYFDQPGSDLVAYSPPDFTPLPPGFLPTLSPAAANGTWRNWSLAVHQIWPQLSRTEAANVSQQPDQHSLLGLPQPFVIAGDRFREQYYWDSYWIIRGLLISNMNVTASSEVANLLALLQRYGHVPNGARSYYINRSQPPLLSQMVRSVYEATQNTSLLAYAVPLLVQEHTYWTTAPKQVTVVAPGGQLYNLSRYYAEWDRPRPESFAQDSNTSAGLDPVAASQLYRELASGAESGQDFSSRWFADGRTLRTIRTTSTIPADLNAFLLLMERNIAAFANVTGNSSLAAQFTGYAATRQAAIDAVLWSSSRGCWTDFVLDANASAANGSSCPAVYTGGQRNGSVYAADYVPLWAGALPAGDARLTQMVASLNSSGLLLPGGIATSLTSTGQQWDYPNAWPPLNHMIIEGLATAGGDGTAAALAADLAQRYLLNAFRTFYATGGLMSEKLDAAQPGTPGGGGEYTPQVGFGWSNGVALDLLNRYGAVLGAPPANGTASNGPVTGTAINGTVTGTRQQDCQRDCQRNVVHQPIEEGKPAVASSRPLLTQDGRLKLL